MGKYIKDRKPAEDSWLPYTGLEGEGDLPEGDIYVPFDAWLDRREDLLKRNSRLGVILENTDDIYALEPDLERLDLIVLQFPKMTDGRAFTQARLLRERLGFKGEIRAAGDVLQDQVFYMQRCGFSSFELRDDQDVPSVLKAFDEMSVTYQGAADTDAPIWRR
ncbi:DUF934 domain-containing protein [Sneathiella sp. P13V-1]|uniref:DUF934 domain-containing protein n=1 Tax=Sneathiella sp. P13V-1 TaxID=2697366 RepID=UPI00187B97FB|nr:DUF934 domain-containing protein [Sneathiella sp. P13V-1]MBE7636539.1 DUF934 domain-containing protein [Sneathiella sp. P13V-1]